MILSFGPFSLHVPGFVFITVTGVLALTVRGIAVLAIVPDPFDPVLTQPDRQFPVTYRYPGASTAVRPEPVSFVEEIVAGANVVEFIGDPDCHIETELVRIDKTDLVAPGISRWRSIADRHRWTIDLLADDNRLEGVEVDVEVDLDVAGFGGDSSEDCGDGDDRDDQACVHGFSPFAGAEFFAAVATRITTLISL